MALLESGSFELDDSLVIDETQLMKDRMEIAATIEDVDEAIEFLYPTERISDLTKDLLEATKFHEISNGRKWAVAVLSGDDPRADISRKVEMDRFCKEFGYHPTQHYIDYGQYDQASIFITVIDGENPDNPTPAAVLRIVRNSEIGLKTVNTLVNPDPEENPWSEEISDLLGELSYENRESNERAIEQMFGIEPSKTWAIETMAVLKSYAGKKGEFGEASFPLYAACLQLSDRSNIESWVSIQDIKPLLQMQALFASPWTVAPLGIKNYQGPHPVVPAAIQFMPEAQAQLREQDPETGELLIDGINMELSYVMPQELQGEDYLDAVARLSDQ